MSLGVPNDRRFPSLQQSIQEDTSPTSYTGLDSFVSTGAAFSFQQVPTNPSTPSKAFAAGGPLAPTSSPFSKKAGAAPAINIMNTMQQDGLADLDMDLMTDDNQPHHDGDFDIDLDVSEAKYDDGDIDLDVDVNFNDQMIGFGQENDYQMAGDGQGGGNIVVEEADDVMVDEMGDAQQQQQQQQQQDDVMIPDEPNVQSGSVTVVESTSLTVEMSTAPVPSSPLPMDEQSSPVVPYQTLATQTQTQTQTPTQTQQPFPPSTADTAPFQSHEVPSANTQVDNSVTPTKPLSPPSHQSSQTQPPTHFSPPPPTQTPQFSPSHNAAPAETHFSPPVQQQPVYNSPPIQKPDDSVHPSRNEQNNIQQQQPPLPSPSLVGNVTSSVLPVHAPSEHSRNSTPPAPVVPLEERQHVQQEQQQEGEAAQEESHEEYRYNQEFENHELDDQDFNNEVDNDNFNHEDDHNNEVVENVEEEEEEEQQQQPQEVDQQGYATGSHHQEAEQSVHEVAYEHGTDNNIQDLPEEVRVSQAETAELDESPEVLQREWVQHPHAVTKIETTHVHHEQGNYQLDVATSIATEVAEEETSRELERGSPTPTDQPSEEPNEHAATPPQDGSYEENEIHAEENVDDEHIEQADEEYHQEYPSHPIVVLYKDTEYSLYHDEKNNNVENIPQSFILADNTLTGKSFSHTMAALREVMVNELDPNDEIVLKVRDLDLIFEEHNSQNNDITVFHLTDLFLQLSSQDGNENPGPLYFELQRRPRYLTKLDLLKDHVLAGGGLASLKKMNTPVEAEYANGTVNEPAAVVQDEKEEVDTSRHEGDEDLELEEFEKVPEEELLGQDEIQQTEADDKKADEKDELELSEEEYETLQNADDLEDSVVVGGKYNNGTTSDQSKQAGNDEGEQFDFEDDHQAQTRDAEEGDDSLIGFDEELGQREAAVKQNTSQQSAAVNKPTDNKQSAEDDDILDVVQVKSRPVKAKADDDDDIGDAITVQKSPAKPSVSTRSHHQKTNSNNKAAPAKAANPAPAKDWIKLGEPYDDDSKDADGDDDDFDFDINDNDVPVKSGNNGSAKHNGGDASLDFYEDNTFEEEGAEFSVYPDLRDSPPIGDHINVAPAGEKRARDEEEGDTIVVNPGFYSASKRRRAS